MNKSEPSKAFLIGWPIIGSLYLALAIWDFVDGSGWHIPGIVWSIFAIAWGMLYIFQIKKSRKEE